LLALVAFTGVTLWKAARHERQAEATWPPEGDVLTIDGHRVHYVVMGEGPDLVLIHGASGNTRDFTHALAGRLAARYRVIVMDRPGLGYTDRIDPQGASLAAQAGLLADARRAARGRPAHRLRPFLWRGRRTGLGAQPARQRLGARALGGGVEPLGHGARHLLHGPVPPAGPTVLIPLLTAWVPDRVVDRQIDAVFVPQTAPEGYHTHIGAGLTLRRVSMRANALHRRNLLGEITRQAPRYGEIDLPVEILHGDADDTVPLAVHSEPLSRQLPNARLTVLPGVGHMLHHADPDAVEAAIDRAADARRSRPLTSPEIAPKAHCA
jgi:pimeloyl-ACP methyl ester carboxylesterase